MGAERLWRCYNDRPIRGNPGTISNHPLRCKLISTLLNNPLGAKKFKCLIVVTAFKNQRCLLGAETTKNVKDGMHFELSHVKIKKEYLR